MILRQHQKITKAFLKAFLKYMSDVHNEDRVYKLTILQFSGDLVYFTINNHKVCTVLARPRKSAKLAYVSLVDPPNLFI